MNQEKTQKKRSEQVFYNGRWIDKDHFRAFIYNGADKKLAESYKQYEDLLSTGLWFSSTAQALEAKKPKLVEVVPEPIPTGEVLELKKHKARKPKHGADS